MKTWPADDDYEGEVKLSGLQPDTAHQYHVMCKDHDYPDWYEFSLPGTSGTFTTNEYNGRPLFNTVVDGSYTDPDGIWVVIERDVTVTLTGDSLSGQITYSSGSLSISSSLDLSDMYFSLRDAVDLALTTGVRKISVPDIANGVPTVTGMMGGEVLLYEAARFTGCKGLDADIYGGSAPTVFTNCEGEFYARPTGVVLELSSSSGTLIYNTGSEPGGLLVTDCTFSEFRINGGLPGADTPMRIIDSDLA